MTYTNISTAKMRRKRSRYHSPVRYSITFQKPYIERRGRPRKGFRSTKAIIKMLIILAILMIITLWIEDRLFIQPKLSEATDRAYALQGEKLAQKNAEIRKVQQESMSKENRITELRNQFNELMSHPISFQQRYFLEHEILPRTRKFGIPDELASSQWAIESSRGVNRADNNYFGLMSWDSYGNRSLMQCSTLDKCVEVYASTVSRILRNKGYDLAKMKDAAQIAAKLQEGNLRYEGDNADPKEYVALLSGTEEWKYYANN